MSFSRRGFLKYAGTGLVTTAGVLTLGPTTAKAANGVRVNGSGSYNLGPFEHGLNPEQEAFLVTDLGFDETMLFCKVTTNFDPFLFPSAGLGVVPLAEHEFFMDMQSTRIDSLVVEDGPDGPRALYTGVMRSETRVFSGSSQATYIEEEIGYDCEAEDHFGTPSETEITENVFSMTAHFASGGGHAALFGESATFAGTLTSGNIVIDTGVGGQLPTLALVNTTDASRSSNPLVGDGWRLDLSNASPNASVYLQIWKENVDLGVAGPLGGTTDSEGAWSFSGSFDSSFVGSWRVKAIIGDVGSPERSSTVLINVS